MATAAGRKRQWLFAPDVTEGSESELPLELSSFALGQGWTGIERTPVESVDSTEVEKLLREDFYDGESFRRLVNEPLLYAVAAWLTGADRGWAQQYQIDDILRYSRTSKETGIEKGEYSRVLAVNAQANTLTVVRGNGEQTSYDPRRQVGVSVYREDEKKFSVGDRVQFTAPSQELKIANRYLGTVESIGRDGTMRLRLDDERKVEFNPQQHPHVDHGYAVTSYSSQGQTAERVLVNVDTELAAKDLLNSRMAYVSISRGQFDAQIFTDNRDKLPQALGQDVSHQSAYKPEQSIPKIPAKSVRALHQEPEISIGFGLSL